MLDPGCQDKNRMDVGAHADNRLNGEAIAIVERPRKV